ncbi:O-antigen ligase family protein [Bacillus sp. FSL K6-3431]|uniref:O-antigen ligase family protein n=1 Tax=Bacillus sp. FSL K6-3431 TaxID=2921500 RepID=UPI0030FAB75A
MVFRSSKLVYLIFLFYLGLFSSLFFTIPGATLVLGLGMIVLLLFSKFSREELVQSIVIPKALLLLISFAFYSLLTGSFVATNTLHLVDSVFTYFQMIALIFFIINVSALENSNIFFVKSFILFSIIYMLFMLIGGHTRVDGRLTLVFGENPNNDARILLYGMACLLINIKQTKLSTFLLTISLTGMFLYTIALTGSRKGFYAAIILAILWLVFVYKDYWKSYSLKNKFGSVILLLAIMSFVILKFWDVFLDSSIFQRMSAKGITITDDLERTTMYQEAFTFFKDNLLFGIGFDHFRLLSSFGTYSHSTYAELISNTGLIGTIIYLTAYLIILYNLINLAIKSKGTTTSKTAISNIILFFIMLALGTGVIHFYGIIDNIMLAILISFYYTEKENIKRK